VTSGSGHARGIAPDELASSARVFQQREVRFQSGAEECAAWLYRPARQPGALGPAIVLGPGLGAVREMRLDAYASRFAAAGYTALVFDYRHFGASGGHPRQLLDINRQLTDWAAAIAYVRTQPEVDANRVALWGTSFSGGYVLITAARDPCIAAVIAQCPFTDGLSSALTLGLRSLLKVGALAIRDQLAAVRGMPQVRVKLVGQPGSAALMPTPDAEAGYRRLLPPGLPVEDEVAARVALRIPLRRPGRYAARLSCPALFCVCDADSVAPSGPTLRYAARAPHAEIVRYPIGHFALYFGDDFERALSDQLAFLRRHLPIMLG
jgi:pimeloyl-ACP methyl ester carboxylesterase